MRKVVAKLSARSARESVIGASALIGLSDSKRTWRGRSSRGGSRDREVVFGQRDMYITLPKYQARAIPRKEGDRALPSSHRI